MLGEPKCVRWIIKEYCTEKMEHFRERKGEGKDGRDISRRRGGGGGGREVVGGWGVVGGRVGRGVLREIVV